MVTKDMFFDRKAVTSAVDRAARKVLSKFGAFVRTTAKSSIRKRKGASKPGSPPHSHVGFLKRFIYFGYDAAAKSVVIGPTPLRAVVEAPPALEYGGTVTVGGKPLAEKFALGGYGPVRIGPEAAGSPHARLVPAGPRKIAVVAARLLSAAMVARAVRLTQEINRSRRRRTVNIKARPYMGPAFEKEQANLPAMWAGSVKA